MRIYPAIDLFEGKAVRLSRGDFQSQTVYSDHPEEIARQWQDEGAEWLHVVDLEGAKSGQMANRESLLKIRKAVQCKIQFGGGMRTKESIEDVFREGVDRVVIGTKSLDRPFLQSVLSAFGKRIAVGLDVREGAVRMMGWAEDTGMALEKAVDLLNELIVETLIYTDIQRDGMLAGPDFLGLEALLGRAKARVILSGGVASLKDIERAARINRENFEGVIVGKALYEKKFSLKDAIKTIREVKERS